MLLLLSIPGPILSSGSTIYDYETPSKCSAEAMFIMTHRMATAPRECVGCGFIIYCDRGLEEESSAPINNRISCISSRSSHSPGNTQAVRLARPHDAMKMRWSWPPRPIHLLRTRSCTLTTTPRHNNGAAKPFNVVIVVVRAGPTGRACAAPT